MKVPKVFVLLLVLICCSFAQVTKFGCLSCSDQTRSTQMMSSYYTHKAVGDISALGSVVTVSTTWPKYLIAGVYNPRRDSSAFLQCISQAGDTAKYSIPTESPLGIKPPPIAKIITAGSTDSLIFEMQLLTP